MIFIFYEFTTTKKLDENMMKLCNKFLLVILVWEISKANFFHHAYEKVKQRNRKSKNNVEISSEYSQLKYQEN